MRQSEARALQRDMGVYYEDGSAARQTETTEKVPLKQRTSKKRTRAQKKAAIAKKIRRRRKQKARMNKIEKIIQMPFIMDHNRKLAMKINRGAVIFIAVISLVILHTSVYYIRMRASCSTMTREIAILESQLVQEKELNDAYYSQVTMSVDLTMARTYAIAALGMKYPTEDHIIRYTVSDTGSFVRQYQDLPEDDT